MAAVPLLERRARGVVPTAAGEAFLEHARRVVNEADRAGRAARDAARGVRGIALGAIPSAALGIVPAALRAVDQGGRARSWSLTPGPTADLEAGVAAGELDLAVVSDAPPGLADHPRLTRRTIGVDEMRVIVPPHHPAAGAATPVPLATLASETWVEDNDGSAAILRSTATRAGFDADIDLSAGDLAGKAALVAAGHAVALVPGLLVPALRPDVRAVRIVHPPTRGIFVTTPSAASRADLDDVVRALADALAAAGERASPAPDRG